MRSIWTRHPARGPETVAVLALIGFSVVGGAFARGQGSIDAGGSFSQEERRRILELSPLGPPSGDPSNAVADDAAAARLGQRLFFEPRLSSGDVSCATCHVPTSGFTDGKQLSVGMGRGRRHTPSLWNVAYNRWYFWDGRADSLWSQSLSPIETDSEMAGDRLRAMRLLEDDPGLRAAYETVFGPRPDLSDRNRFPAAAHPVPGRPDDPRTLAWTAMQDGDRAAVDTVFTNLGKSIAAYERRLISRRAAFDQFVDALRAGRDDTAFSLSARRGLKVFIGRGQCRVCHGGPNFTDGEFHNTGVPALAQTGPADAGRHDGIALLLASPFNLLGRNSDDRGPSAGQLLRFLRKTPESWGQFKTPSLRNVARVAPYMHQGQLATLRDVLQFYSERAGSTDSGANGERILKPLHLTPGEIEDLLAFLESLTDEAIDPELMRAPAGAGHANRSTDRGAAGSGTVPAAGRELYRTDPVPKAR